MAQPDAPGERVPLGPAGATAGPPATRPEGPPADCPQVLVLDDEPWIRAYLDKALAVSGIGCTAYQDGARALEGLAETTCDVMLIDHRMAGMSGTEFYEAAVARRPDLARRAVFMSGDVLDPQLRAFATQRRIRLLAKPFDIEAVVSIVRASLAESAAEAAAGQAPAGETSPGGANAPGDQPRG